MRLTVIIRTLGVLFLLFSTTLLPPIVVSLVYNDGEVQHFSLTFAIALVAGVVLWLPFRHDAHAIRSRDGFLIVALMWTAMSLLGTVPFMAVARVELSRCLLRVGFGLHDDRLDGAGGARCDVASRFCSIGKRFNGSAASA